MTLSGAPGFACYIRSLVTAAAVRYNLLPAHEVEAPLITLPKQAGATQLLDGWLLANHAMVYERIECNYWGAVAGMLREGVGVGFLPADWATALRLHTVGSRTPPQTSPLRIPVAARGCKGLDRCHALTGTSRVNFSAFPGVRSCREFAFKFFRTALRTSAARPVAARPSPA